MEHYVLTLRCAEQPGIVRALAEGVVQAKGNILDSAQFSPEPLASNRIDGAPMLLERRSVGPPAFRHRAERRRE
jgi:hypothetical protein